jgi:cyclohexanecarboxylate-CoA ligase
MGEQLVERYARAVERRPDALAAVDERGRRLTHRALWDEAGRVADLLGDGGVRPRDVVLCFLPNWTDWMVLFLASLRLGAIPATGPSTMDEASLRHAISLVRARVVAVPAAYRRPTADVARDAIRELDHPCSLLLADGEEWRWGVVASGSAPGDRRLDGAEHVMFTSSTTGLPKATMSTDAGLNFGNLAVAERYGLTEATPIFMPSPLGHSIGTCHGARMALYLGAPIVLQDAWDPEAALRLMSENDCFFTAAATPFLKDVVETIPPSAAGQVVGVWLCGGAPVPPQLIESAFDALPKTFVTNLWGMTEAGMAACPLDAPREKVANTSGTALGCELRVVDQDGNALPAGQEGELTVSGEDVILGYVGDSVLLDSMRLPNGDLRSGDLATIDGEGYVTITGRIKDLIIRGGVNIAPTPIEAALSTHPAVAKVAVIGLPDDRLGERICAVVVPRGDPPDLASLVRWAGDRGLPKRQWPEAIRVVDDMPTTPAGKVKKQALRELLERP